ncbi:hypothetical protein E4U23_001985 [Claviceps purpurea]|nr:hypothetical protein E4U23_001985 [Claviceps purpurea]
MVKISSIFITLLAAISPVVQAGCTPGLNYCGWNLRKYGGTNTNMLPILGYDGLTLGAVYHCSSGGVVTKMEFCETGCADGGTGMNDHC